MKKVNAVRPKNENNFLRLLLSLKLAEYKIAAESFSEIVFFLVQYSFLFEDTEKVLNSCGTEQSQLYALQENRGLGARYLDPKYSMWISTDPALSEYMAGTEAGCGGIYNSINLSLYHYAGNNPVKFTDPDGCSIASLFLSIKLTVKIYKEVSTMPSQSEHYSRNNSNVDIGTDWNSANKLAEQGQVIRMSEGKDSYHEQGTATGYDPGMNDKFVSLDGKNETVYNKETGQKITDPVNQGTYNRADPNKDPIGHFFQDMIPYYVWGNSEDDPTTAWERITGSYQGNVNATKEEASQFRAQMNEENRNKAMEQYYEHH